MVILPVISALGRLRQEDGKFEANLGYVARSCFKTKKQKKQKQTKTAILITIITNT
jgi:hypothetical protein